MSLAFLLPIRTSTSYESTILEKDWSKRKVCVSGDTAIVKTVLFLPIQMEQYHIFIYRILKYNSITPTSLANRSLKSSWMKGMIESSSGRQGRTRSVMFFFIFY